MRYAQSLSKRMMQIMLAILLVAVPVSAVELVLEHVPGEYTHDQTIDIGGTTDRGATVQVFVNDIRQRAVTTTSGIFRFRGIVVQTGENTVRVESKSAGEVATSEFTVLYDGTPPTVTLDAAIPAATKAGSLTITGDVDEPVTILYRVTTRQDRIPPALVGGLDISNIEDNAIELAWDPTDATDFQTYLILRNGARIASTTVTSFRDEGLPSDKKYSYTVSAVDSSCNVGDSAIVTATTLSGGDELSAPDIQEVRLSCEPEFQTMSAGSPFSITLPLSEGYNDIEIYFDDIAGNRHAIVQTVLVDNAPPVFEETNLDQISPSYTPEIKIKGKLNEQATVFVYINDDSNPAEFEVTEEDGSFTIPVNLRTDKRIKTGAKQTTAEIGEGWANVIRLEAVDLSGNVGNHGPSDVNFLLCGQGTWWQANIEEASPTTLMPRLMVQGVQQIGIPFNVTYIGNYPSGTPPRVDVRPIALSRAAEDDFDHDWVTITDYAGTKTPSSYTGYVQVQFENVNPLPDDPKAGMNAKEIALSGHRRGECLVPGLGCVRLFLQMEILFQEKIPLRATDPRVPTPSPDIENRVQRICMPVEVAIDQTIPHDVIPKGMLTTALKVIDKAINLIDKVLEPITTIGEYVLYGCLASNVWLLVNFFQERMACEGTQILTAFDGTFNKGVAEAGLCDEVYGANSESSQKQQSCKRCESTIATRKKFETNVMHGLCDRIGCPSAPTFSTYIKDQAGLAEIIGEVQNAENNPELAKWAINGKLYSGNDCAFSYKTPGEFITPTYGGIGRTKAAVALPDVGYEPAGEPTHEEYFERVTPQHTGLLGIREMRDIAKAAAEPTAFPAGPKAEDCKQTLHPAHPNCCGTQYQKDWSSACGPGSAVGILDTFDELDESTCLSGEYANADTTDLNCKTLWNSVAGFCEDNTGDPSPQAVNTEATWNPVKPGADDNLAYIFIIPDGFKAGGKTWRAPIPGFLGARGTTNRYNIYRGYAIKTPEFMRNADDDRKQRGFRLTAGLTAEVDKDLTRCFTQQKNQPVDEKAQRECLYNTLCDGKITPCTKGAQIDRIYRHVNEIVGISDQEYIVRPYSGLLRSTQCACIPAVASYLHMWRSVLGAFHGCFSKILLTGEGSEGFCAAKLSGTICDLFFEALSCFTQKFSAPGVGGRAGLGGFGDVMGALTGAGTDVTRSVNQRYGETSLYKSLFSERKLVHAICNWAFTGTWDLDVSGLFQQQVDEIPVDSEGALTTCQRTYIAYDPTTSPPGLTTWAYRIAGGLIAGSDVRYRLLLKCSSGFACDPRDYPDGKCDCSAKEEVLPVSSPELGNGIARKFDMVNFDAPFVVSPQNSHDMAGYRYDTAILEMEWVDPTTKQVRVDKVDCSIRETTGGGAPAFCALDAFSGKFRCVFGEQDSGVRMGTANPQYPEGQDAFAIGQHLNFTLPITQQFPDTPRKQRDSTKFFLYDIRDAAGTTIKAADGRDLKIDINTVPQQYHLTTDGTYQFNVPRINDATPLGTFVLKEEIIKRHSARGTTAKPPQQYSGISTSKRFVNSISMIDNAGESFKGTRRFVIQFPDVRQDPLSYVVKMVKPGLTSVSPKPGTGWLDYTDLEVHSGTQLSGNLINRVSFPVQTAAEQQSISQYKTYTTTLEFESVTGFNVDSIQILIEYKPAPTGASDPCATKDRIIWTAYFAAHDSSRGAPSEQISTDPETGQQQVQTVSFNVKCADPAEVRAQSVGVKLEDKKQLEILLKDAVKNGELLKKALETDTNLRDQAIKSNVEKAINSVISLEKRIRNEHIKLVPKLSAPNAKNNALKALWDPTIANIERLKTEFLDTTKPIQVAEEKQSEIVKELDKLLKAQKEALAEVAPTPATPTPEEPTTGEQCRALGGECISSGETCVGEEMDADCEYSCCKSVIPKIVSPKFGEVVKAGRVRFEWEPVENRAYRFELYLVGEETPMHETGIIQTAYVPQLEPGDYEWRVGSFNTQEPEVKWSTRTIFGVTE